MSPDVEQHLSATLSRVIKTLEAIVIPIAAHAGNRLFDIADVVSETVGRTHRSLHGATTARPKLDDALFELDATLVIFDQTAQLSDHLGTDPAKTDELFEHVI